MGRKLASSGHAWRNWRSLVIPKGLGLELQLMFYGLFLLFNPLFKQALSLGSFQSGVWVLYFLVQFQFQLQFCSCFTLACVLFPPLLCFRVCLSLCVELLMFFPVVVALPVLIWRVMSSASTGQFNFPHSRSVSRSRVCFHLLLIPSLSRVCRNRLSVLLLSRPLWLCVSSPSGPRVCQIKGTFYLHSCFPES